MSLTDSLNWLWWLIWAAVVAVFVITLPGLTGDDPARYFNIAHHMLQNHNYLVPYWNGKVYPDKPPLFFWLFVLGWKIVGVQAWWPQLLTALFATGTIVITRKIAQVLWPNKASVALMVPYLLIGCFYWIWFAEQIRVDAMLTLAAALGYWSLAMTLRGRHHAWWLYVFAVALGGFSKGPVIFVFIFIPALLMPWWLCLQECVPKTWYAYFAGATALGIAIVLCWAIAAAIHGGHYYASQIFYEQIVHRSHTGGYGRGLDYYAYHLPVWLLPWTLYWPFWRGLLQSRFSRNSLGAVFCCVVLAVSFTIFSLFQQKEPHYLYPIFPVLALVIANAVCNDELRHGKYVRYYQWPVAILFIIFGGALLLLPHLLPYLGIKAIIRTYFISNVSPLWALLFLAIGLLLLLFNTRSYRLQVLLLACSMISIQLYITAIIIPSYRVAYKNPAPMVQKLLMLKQQKVAIAVYQEAWNPAIRAMVKTDAIQSLSKKQLYPWLRAHPNGWLLSANQCILQHQAQQYQHAIAWYYQTRYVIVSLWQAKQLAGLTNLARC